MGIIGLWLTFVSIRGYFSLLDGINKTRLGGASRSPTILSILRSTTKDELSCPNIRVNSCLITYLRHPRALRLKQNLCESVLISV